jgi:hypothetical protein
MTKYMTGCGTAMYESKEEASKFAKSFSTGKNDNYKYSVVAKDNAYIVCWKIPMNIYLKDVEPIYKQMENMLAEVITKQKNNKKIIIVL